MAEFKFSCPFCGQHVQCDTGYAGRQINCPACRQSIVVPSVPPSAAPVPPQPAISPAIRRGTPVLAGAQPPVPAKSRTLKNVLVTAAAVIILAGLVIGGWYGYAKIKHHNASGHLPPGLVALWSGDGDGSDSAGGNKMELTDISFADGKAGKAFSFNGKSSSIKIPASPALDVGMGAGFTITAWIKPSDVRGYHPLFAWTDGTPVNSSICFNASESGVLMVGITDGAGNRFLVSNQGVLVKGRFQHIALTYDKASGIGTWYLNGIVVAQRQLSGNVNSTKGDLWISHRDTSQGNWSSNRSYVGLMDEVALYNRALSASEIQDICAEQNHGEPLTLPTPSTGWHENWMQ